MAIDKKSDYLPIEIHWSMVPGRTQEWKEQIIRNTSEDQFRQEFECVAGDTMIDIMEDDGTEKNMKISDLFARLSS
jgi:hypothetical protein